MGLFIVFRVMYLKKSVSVSNSDVLEDSEPAMRSRNSGIGAGSNL